MLENWKPGFITILLFVGVLWGCARQEGKVLPATPQPATQTPLPTQDQALAETVTALPTYTPLPTGLYATLTLQADERSSSYLLPSEIDAEIAQLIQFALETRLERQPLRGERFYSYVLLKPVEQAGDGSLTAYLYERDREYYVEQGQLKQGGGGDIPVALRMRLTVDGWDVELETPVSGRWGPSIREIFPEEVWPLIFHSPPIPYEAIDVQILQQAEAYFGLIFDPQKNSFPSAENTPTPAFRILTLTPTPTVDINILEPDVSGHANVNAEQISISVDLYPGVSDPFQKGILSAGWHIDLFASGNAQDVLNLDARKNNPGYTGGNEFYVRLTPGELQQRFGDWRGFVYRITDESGEVFWQGDIYLDAGLTPQYVNQLGKDFSNDYAEDVHAGLMVGKPFWLSDPVSPVFLPGEKWIVVKEPPGGFYALTYEYALAFALGLGSTEEAQLSRGLWINLFPYREDGLYKDEEAEHLTGSLSGVSGILSVNFSYEWLEQAHSHEEKYYLRIGDIDGNIYKDAYIWFMPYTP